MKYVLGVLLLCLIFVPSTAFGWKSLSYEEDCNVSCGKPFTSIDYSSPMNFILLGISAMVGLGIFHRVTKTGKFEVFSLHCKTCGNKTNGLKCPLCESKQIM